MQQAAPPQSYTHGGVEEAVGPPGWQGLAAAITPSPAKAACAGLSLTGVGSAGLAALLAHTEPLGVEVELGEGVLLQLPPGPAASLSNPDLLCQCP